MNLRTDLGHGHGAELIAPLSVLPVVQKDGVQRRAIERDEIIVGVVKAKDDPRFGIAFRVDAGHQVGVSDLFKDRDDAFAAHEPAVFPLTRRAVVFPGRALGGFKAILEEYWLL